MFVVFNVSQHHLISVEIQCCHERKMQKQIIGLELHCLSFGELMFHSVMTMTNEIRLFVFKQKPILGNWRDMEK